MAAVSDKLSRWMLRSFARLRGQAFAHLALVALAASAAVAAMGFASFYVIEGREIAQQREDTRQYYGATSCCAWNRLGRRARTRW